MKSKDFEIRTPFLGVGDPLIKVDQLQSSKFLKSFSDDALTTWCGKLFQSLMTLIVKNDDLTLEDECGLNNLKL